MQTPFAHRSTLRRHCRLAAVAATLSLAGPVPSHGMDSDREQPLEIESDSVEFRDRSETAIYRGNVRAVQGSRVLTGDIVTVILQGGEVSELVSEGDLATFHMMREDGEPLDAQSEYMKYEAQSETLLLLRRATVTKTDNTIESERIHYHIPTEVVDAGEPGGEGRVRMVILPGKKDGSR